MNRELKQLQRELHEAKLIPNNGKRVVALTRQFEKENRASWLGSFEVFEVGTYFQTEKDFKKAAQYFREAAKSKYWKVRSLALNYLGALNIRHPKNRSAREAKKLLKEAERAFIRVIRERPSSKAARTARTYLSLPEFQNGRG